QPARDIDPGSNRATLTLADGTKVDLSSAQDGIIVGDGGITYSDGSGILDNRQQTTGNGQTSPMSDVSRLMSLSTPKGGTYQIVLPDGSKVWLNAASTLRYPVRFSGDTRTVFLEGEGFFEVSQQGSSPSGIRPSRTAHSKQQPAPFIVKTRGQETVVLGTAFSISAYPDQEAVKTTLANGSVRVTSLKGITADQSPVTNHQSLILAPGEQS